MRNFSAHNVPEVGVGGKRRGFVQDRLAHHCAHRFARLAVTQFEVLADLRILNVFQAGRPKSAVSEQRRKLEQRHAVRGEHVERIAQKFICARSKVVESPALFQDCGEFCDAHEVGCLLFQRIKADRDFAVRWRDEDDAVT